ncbi:MAG: RHS repeat-associated core domain-containing protein, partial [Rhodoglobus sp.]|nr:RHS repeat-associated core domain-containing protein [Rhodoglobus sp.]
LGAVTRFVYDAAGRQIAETNPLGKTWQYEYDALGRLLHETEAKNQRTSYEYTPRSDLARIDYPSQSDTTFLYDEEQNAIAMTDSLGASGWVFDEAGRLVSQTDSLGAVLGYEYDATGARTALELPGGDSIGFEYDAAGRPVLQTSPWGDLAYGFDAASNLTAVLRSTGVSSEYQYDAASRVTGITHTSPGSELGCDLGANDLEVGATVSIDQLLGVDLCVTVDLDLPVLTGLDYGDSIALDYTYDAVGNVASQTRTDGSAAPVVTGYAYDALNRLTASSGPSSNTYRYDKAGNRTGWSTTKAPDTGKPLTVTAAYNAAGQLTSEVKKRPGLLGSSTVSTSYSYDANGNRIKEQTGLTSTTFSYTDDDKLSTVSGAGRTVTTGYDGLGRALTSTTRSLLILGQTTTQVWDGLEVVQQDAALTGVSNLVRDVTGEVAIQTADGLLSGGDRWGLTDRLGSTVAQGSGSRVSQVVSYSDWGIPTFATVGYNSAAGFTGELGDGVTGLSEYFARAYDPWSASWLQADPYRGTLDAPGAQNRYAYAEGNPVTLQDYYGYSTGRMQVETRQGPRPPSPGSRTADGWVRHFEANPDAPRPSGYTGTWPARHDTCGIEGKPSCGTNSGTTPEKPHMCPLSWEPCSTELYWQEIAVSSIQGFAMAFAFRGRPGATTPRVPVGALSGNRPTRRTGWPARRRAARTRGAAGSRGRPASGTRSGRGCPPPRARPPTGSAPSRAGRQAVPAPSSRQATGGHPSAHSAGNSSLTVSE